MNRRRQIRFTPEEQAAFLRAHRKAALTTMDKDGFPHVVAMNFFVKDGAFYMTSYGKAQKLLEIRRNPKVALMVGDDRADPGRQCDAIDRHAFLLGERRGIAFQAGWWAISARPEASWIRERV